METKVKQLLIYLLLPLFLLLVAVGIAIYQTRPDLKLHVNFYEAGQILIRTYQGNKIIIDGGPDDKILSELGKVLPFYDHKVDLLILTKADDFHATGLVYVLKRYEIKQVILPEGEDSDSSAARELLSLIDQKQITKKYLPANQRIMLDSGTLLDMQAKQISFGKILIELSGYKLGEFVSDGVDVTRK